MNDEYFYCFNYFLFIYCYNIAITLQQFGSITLSELLLSNCLSLTFTIEYLYHSIVSTCDIKICLIINNELHALTCTCMDFALMHVQCITLYEYAYFATPILNLIFAGLF